MDRSAVLITILLSLACGIAANLGTPLLKTLYLKGLFTTQKAMIRRIKGELALIDYYLSNSHVLQLYLFKELFRVIFWILVASALLLSTTVAPTANMGRWILRLGSMVIGFAAGRATANVSFAKSLIDSNDHKKKLLAKLATLESSLPPAEPSGQ